MTGFAALQTMTKVIIKNRGWQIFLPAFFVLPALQPRFKDSAVGCKAWRELPTPPPRLRFGSASASAWITRPQSLF
jgi:hypothetical protein